MNTQEAKVVLEAALLTSEQPLPVSELRRLFDDELNADTIRVLLDELRVEWNGRGVELAAAPRLDVSRRALVNTNIGRAVSDLAQPFVRDPAKPTASALVTALYPFLRWEPVATPVLVPRKRFTEGESLRAGPASARATPPAERTDSE